MIIILLVIVLVFVIVDGVLLLQANNGKSHSKIEITSGEHQYSGGELSICLTDFNKTPILNESVHIIIINSNGEIVTNKTMKTSSNGEIKLDLDLETGEYDVNATFDGNENYVGNNTTQKLIIEEEVVQEDVGEKTIYGYWDTGEPIYDLETWEKFQKYGKSDWPE